MPIIITREGPIEPQITNPLTPQQREELWANIVRSWCEKHPDQLRSLTEPAPVKT